MIYLLDTNACIIYLKGKNFHLKQKLDNIPLSEVAVCSVVKGELFYGSIRSANPERNLTLQQGFLSQFVSLPFDILPMLKFRENWRRSALILGTNCRFFVHPMNF